MARRVELLGLGPAPGMVKRGGHIHRKAWCTGGEAAQAWEGRGKGVGGARQGRGRGVARGGGVPLEVEPLEGLEAHGVRPPVGEAHGRRAGAGVEPVRDDGAATGDEDLGAWYGVGCEVAPR